MSFDKPTERLTAELINPRYLANIGDEPKRILQPITGYAREPLLPVEEACKPLESIIPQLSTYVWIAKENSKTPQDGLTQDESAAIHLYTMEWDETLDGKNASLYAQLNRTLRLADRTKLRPWFRYLKLFLTGLAKIPPVPHQTIWRGVKKDHSAEYVANSRVSWWAFSSCTTSLEVLESDLYLGNTGTRTLFSIEAINGRSVRSHSYFQVEDEILLLPGTYFEVKSQFNPAPDLHIIHLRQQRPPHDLLEPPFEGIFSID